MERELVRLGRPVGQFVHAYQGAKGSKSMKKYKVEEANFMDNNKYNYKKLFWIILVRHWAMAMRVAR